MIIVPNLRWRIFRYWAVRAAVMCGIGSSPAGGKLGNFSTDFESYGQCADPGCLSRIPETDFYPSRIRDPGSWIQDPKTATKGRGEKNCYHTFFCSHTFNKIEYYFIIVLLSATLLTAVCNPPDL